MAIITDEIRALANIKRKGIKVESHLGGLDETQTYIKILRSRASVTNYNLVIETRDTSGEFFWDVGKWDEEYWPYTVSYVEVVRRCWEYNTTTLFETGTYSGNISVNDDKIQLV